MYKKLRQAVASKSVTLIIKIFAELIRTDYYLIKTICILFFSNSYNIRIRIYYNSHIINVHCSVENFDIINYMQQHTSAYRQFSCKIRYKMSNYGNSYRRIVNFAIRV